MIKVSSCTYARLCLTLFVGVSMDVVSNSLSQLTAPEDVHCGKLEGAIAASDCTKDGAL